MKARAAIAPSVAFLACLCLWTVLACTVYADEAYILPKPWDVAAAAAEERDTLWMGISATLRASAAGFGIAAAAGIAAGILMSQSRAVERALYPYAVVLQTVPIVAVAPLIVLWLGYGTRSVIAIAAIISLFPIVNGTLTGLVSTDRGQAELFRLHRAGRLVELWKLRLPAALPALLAGLKVSAGLAVVGAIVGEFVVGSGNSTGGLGVQVIFSQGRLDTDLLFAQVIAATTLGVAFFTVVGIAQHLLLRGWHESALRTAN